MKQKDTIEWFEIAKDGYPPKDDAMPNGIWVLCYFGKNSTVDSYFYWWNNMFSSVVPTHWAYINLPEL